MAVCSWLWVTIFLGVVLCLSTAVSTFPTVVPGVRNCSLPYLEACKENFDENRSPLCSEVLDLWSCLVGVRGCRKSHRWVLRLTYKTLLKKVRSYPTCLKHSLEEFQMCNETLARLCYKQFNKEANPLCPEVKRLQKCIGRLRDCHIMKHPSYVLSQGILSENRKCFFVNYSRILQVLKAKEAASTELHTVSPEIINTTQIAAVATGNTDSGHHFLPYTFVIVATVFTCLFLIVLVVFSVMRHTTLARRQQRQSQIERTPTRIRVRSRHRLRRLHRNRHRQRHMYVITGPRQTVTGFFEGNVAPPPYSAVLDDSESLRAGDRPPPYHSQSLVAIGVIV